MSDDQFTVDGIFQARVSSKRESKAGIFLTVEIPADDYSPALAQLRAGSLLKMGWQELVDVSVQPIEVQSVANTDGDLKVTGAVGMGGLRSRPDSRERPAQPKKRFEDYPLSAQCAMRCEDAEFRAFLTKVYGIADDAVVHGVRLICRVTSRRELDTNLVAADAWVALEAGYQNWLTDQRYPAGARR